MVDQGTELSNGFMMSDFATNGAHDGVQSHVNARVMAKHDITEGVRQEEKGKEEMNEENEGAGARARRRERTRERARTRERRRASERDGEDVRDRSRVRIER